MFFAVNRFFEVAPSELNDNVFRQIGREWMLISAGKQDDFNTMTASWGGFGVLWNKNVSFVFVRPSRYTFEFMEGCGEYSLSFFGETNRKPVQFCGAHSGRDTDKMKGAGITPVFSESAPYYDECRMTVICRKMYAHDLDPTAFLDNAIDGNYPSGDYHRMYVGEIIKVLKSEF